MELGLLNFWLGRAQYAEFKKDNTHIHSERALRASMEVDKEVQRAPQYADFLTKAKNAHEASKNGDHGQAAMFHAAALTNHRVVSGVTNIASHEKAHRRAIELHIKAHKAHLKASQDQRLSDYHAAQDELGNVGDTYREFTG